MRHIQRLWRWIVGVVRTTEYESLVPIELERLPEPDSDGKPQYILRLGVRAGFDSSATARVPIYSRPNDSPHPILKEIHWCEVAGTRLEAANVWSLREKVRRALATIAPADSLPLCYFRAPAMDYSLPVYERSGRVVCPIISGPNLKAADIAEMSRHVNRYLESAGYIGGEDEVEIGVVRPSDLKLVPPAAVIRSLEDPDLWLPAIEGRTETGEEVVGVLGQPTRLRAPERERAGSPADESPPAEPDIASLLRYLETELARSGQVKDPASIYAATVRAEIWRRVEAGAAATDLRATCWLADKGGERLELPLRRTGAGHYVVALDDQGIVAFSAPEPGTLAATLGRYLAGRGFLRWEDQVEIETAGAPRAERLAPDEIWTGFRTSNDFEEVVGQ